MEPQPAPQATEANNWPGAFKIFKPSKRIVGFNFAVYIALSLTLLPISMIVGSVTAGLHSRVVDIIFNVVIQLVSLLFTCATSVVLLLASESKLLSYTDALKQSYKIYARYLALSILTLLITIASLLLFVVPFFIVFPRIVLAQYFMIDQDMGAIDALKASWNQTSGHVGKLYGILGVNILMFLTIVPILTLPLTIYLLVAYSAASVIVYKYIITGAIQEPEAAISAPTKTAVNPATPGA